MSKHDSTVLKCKVFGSYSIKIYSGKFNKNRSCLPNWLHADSIKCFVIFKKITFLTVMSSTDYNQTVISSTGYNQRVMSSTGYNQTVMPSAGYNQAVMSSAGYNQTVMSSTGYNQTVILPQATIKQ